MKTSQTRKEEAELRQIAKKARLARKESKSRIRKSKLRQIRLAQKVNNNGKPINGSIHHESSTSTKTTAADEVSHNRKGKRQGAIILPEEVAELKMRFMENNNKNNNSNSKDINTNNAEALTKGHDNIAEISEKRSKITQYTKRTKKNEAQQDLQSAQTTNSIARKGENKKLMEQKRNEQQELNSKKRNTKGKQNVNAVNDKVSSINSNNSSNSNNTSVNLTAKSEEPNYHMEIHFKRKEVLVDVILHHVPFNKINVNESTSQRLVVDTSSHTKKYRLELNMPEGVVVNIDAASFEWEAGVLKCVLPIVNETLPLSLQTEWDAMRDKMQKDKRLRFRLHEDGGLTMRSRQAVLKMKDIKDKSKRPQLTNDTQEEEEEEEEYKEHQAKAQTKKLFKHNKKEQEWEEEQEQEEEENEEELVTNYKKHKEQQKSEINDQHGSNNMNNINKSKEQSNKANNSTTTEHPEKSNLFASERAAAMAIATEVATRAKQSIREKVKLAQEVQRRRQARLEVRSTRKEMKDAKRQWSFARVLEEQKQQLLARAALQASIQKEAELHRTAKREAKRQQVSNIINDNKSMGVDEGKLEKKKKVRFAE